MIGEGESSSAAEIDSNAPQVNDAVVPSQKKEDPPQNLDPPPSPYVSPRTAKKADSWIKSIKDTDDEGEDDSDASPQKKTSTVGDLRSKFENKDNKKPEVKKGPVFIQTNNTSQNDVYFRSTAMGIRLKRGEDGFVRVVSVTEATTGSSIVRDGAIEPEDRVLEAAGVDLHEPITNSQWGETVTKIRNAPRPMKFIVAAGPKRKSETETKTSSAQLPPPPAKYVLESRLSKSPPGQQVLETMAQGNDSAQKIYRAKTASSRTTASGDSTVASRSIEEDPDTEDPRKESIFKRIAAGCTTPVVSACSAPTNQTPSSHQSDDNDDGSKVPMAHLQFLRTNPTIARVTNAASRRYPAFCGRPDTIYEEQDAADTRDTRTSRTHKHHQPSYSMSKSRSAASSSTDSQTMATLSTYDDGTRATTAVLPNAGSGGSGVNKAQQLLGNAYGAPPPQHQFKGNALDWPEDNPDQFSNLKKDTIETSSTHSSNGKTDAERKAELLAASSVEEMMQNSSAVINELHNVHPDDQCEI